MSQAKRRKALRPWRVRERMARELARLVPLFDNEQRFTGPEALPAVCDVALRLWTSLLAPVATSST